MLSKLSLRRTIETGLPILILFCFLFINFYFLFKLPYLGFDLNTTDGKVVNVWVERPAFQSLQPGDQLLQIGLLDWATIFGDKRQPVLRSAETGDVVEIRVLRNNQEITIPWRLSGPEPEEFIARLSIFWLWFIFWFAGTATILLVRPRSIRRELLITFFYLMAAMLMVGSLSAMGIWYSRILFRVIAWLLLPVFLHLSWVFPRPLGRISARILWAMYLFSGLLVLLELFQLLPPQAYAIGILLALTMSVVLLFLHAILRPDERRDSKVLVAALLLTVFSGILLSFQAITSVALQFWFFWAALLSISAFPGAYFYVIYRRQLSGLELKANRIISFYLFSVLLITFAIFAVWFTNFITLNRVSETGIEIAGLFLTSLVAILIYPGFQRLIERRVLGMPLPPAHLIETYAAKITTSVDSTSLVNLLKVDILPSLLVYQSALLGVEGEDFSYVLYSQEVVEEDLPTWADIPDLIRRSNKYLSEVDNPISNSLNWIRLVLPLEVNGKLIGIWLMGRRDPDNFYDQSEIIFLRTIANQTAIALTNISHTKLLHALYHADIERNEKERAALARGLHDEVLNQLAVISMRQPSISGVDAFQESEELIANYLREVISNLRPPMLNYGLRPAIDELVDNLSQRVPEYPIFEVNLEPDSIRFDPNIEQHVFRIVQQACENAVQHAHARCIRISGALESETIHLKVVDDGIGYRSAGSNDLEQLLQQGHYGLVGMYERASIIGADLKIQSQHGQGTLVEVVWPKNQDGEKAPINP